MNEPDLDGYTIEELEEMNEELMSRRAALIVNQRAIANKLDEKRMAMALAADLRALRERHGVQVDITG